MQKTHVINDLWVLMHSKEIHVLGINTTTEHRYKPILSYPSCLAPPTITLHLRSSASPSPTVYLSPSLDLQFLHLLFTFALRSLFSFGLLTVSAASPGFASQSHFSSCYCSLCFLPNLFNWSLALFYHHSLSFHTLQSTLTLQWVEQATHVCALQTQELYAHVCYLTYVPHCRWVWSVHQPLPPSPTHTPQGV